MTGNGEARGKADLDSWLEYGSERVPELYEEVVRGKGLDLLTTAGI